MAPRKQYAVDYAGGVCIREAPSTKAKIMRIVPYGAKIKPGPQGEAPDGWLAVDGGGYVMKRYLR